MKESIKKTQSSSKLVTIYEDKILESPSLGRNNIIKSFNHSTTERKTNKFQDIIKKVSQNREECVRT